MARYRLLTPHYLEIGVYRTPRLVEAQTIIDTVDLPAHWVPTPHMEPLDDQAYAALRAECDRIRAGCGGITPPGYGPMHRMPGGDHEFVPIEKG